MTTDAERLTRIETNLIHAEKELGDLAALKVLAVDVGKNTEAIEHNKRSCRRLSDQYVKEIKMLKQAITDITGTMNANQLKEARESAIIGAKEIAKTNLRHNIIAMCAVFMAYIAYQTFIALP